jgi:hypothetical protein
MKPSHNAKPIYIRRPAAISFANALILGGSIFMAKKTGFSDSSLWITVVVLLAIAAWTYFRR